MPPKVAVVIKQRKVNRAPIILYPPISIGILSAIIKTPVGSPVKMFMSEAAPLTPPPTILFGTKNTLKLSEYDIEASAINAYLFIISLTSVFFIIVYKLSRAGVDFRSAIICFHFKNPLTISSSACFSVSPKVISLISCSPAILPIAAS